MKAYRNKIICSDCIDLMRKLPENCIDTIITDPPYGLGFMGKEWDTFSKTSLKHYHESHSFSKNKRRKEKSAFTTRATAAGSYDFSLHGNKQFQEWFTVWAAAALRVCKPGAMMLIFGGTRTFHRLACAIEDAGWQIRDTMMWLYGSGFPKSHDISKAIDKAKGKEKIIGKGRAGKTALGQTAGWNKTNNPHEFNITEPQTNLAKQWDGYGTALKPAWEPIIVAMKPLDGTFAENAERHGVAGLNIDGGRIGTKEEIGRDNRNVKTSILNPAKGWNQNSLVGLDTRGMRQDRWPANLILDEQSAAMVDEQSGESTSHIQQSRQVGESKFYNDTPMQRPDSSYTDSGGASRFFYCAKASRGEREGGLKGYLACVGCGQLDTDYHRNERGIEVKCSRNNHPTVKPLALIEYLCRLTKTPTGGLVFDPFGGSGTTAVACINTGRDYLLCEKDRHYCEIAERRVKWAKEQQGLFGGQP